jgi:DNA-binding helix-hairpin-helix protein with protein kinase domain
MGKEMGRGGEGSVFEVLGEPSLVAKVYHKRPLPEGQVAKLEAMVACWSSGLEAISAWPRSLLFDPISKKPCGILMTKMSDARPLHELYGTTNRRKHFPDVGWHHLVLAARNTAAAFQTLHSANIVVGDVNQGNMLVDPRMCVRLIDCDSFQLTRNGRMFNCPVGTPHFTPPELQTLKLREVPRTPNHDRFGLAVLVFHLLFVGRHPFAGRYRGVGDLSIEKAIAERRFAFSRDKAATLVDPPPASLLLDDLPSEVAELFENAFRTAEGERPTPLEWVERLETLMRRRKICGYDTIHVYFNQLHDCPWCRIEDGGGPAFFVPASGQSAVSADRLAALDDRIWDLREYTFPELAADRLALPSMPARKPAKTRLKKALPDFASLMLVASLVLGITAPFAGGWMGLAGLATGTVLSLIFAGSLLAGRQARERRKTVAEAHVGLAKSTAALQKRAQAIQYQHRQREAAFDRAVHDLKAAIEHYRIAADNLRDVIAQHSEMQKADYLRNFIIRDYLQQIPGLKPSDVSTLESFGVETANDITALNLDMVPNVDPEVEMELTQWRSDVERNFMFNPEHGITLADVGVAKDAAVRRFKISQARKILTAAKQIEALADVAKVELARALVPFDDAAEEWRRKARELQEFEASRPLVERTLNRTPLKLVGLAIGVPAAAWLLYLLFLFRS